MPPLRGKKRKSNESAVSYDEAIDMTGEKIPTKSGEDDTQQSPSKKRKMGLTLVQKQALIEDLRLEITERARRLRSNYNIHAQTLRTRVEMRVTRISRRLRDITMGELVEKYSAQQQQTQQRDGTKGPPVPEKDNILDQHPNFRRPLSTVPGSPARPPKRMSNEISGDKENEMAALNMPKKKARPGPAAADIARNPAQVLSPTSSNSRLNPRDRPASPAKSGIARPVSPTKLASATNLLSNMVEKARSTRAAATNRKTTTSTTASSSNGSTTTTTASTSTRGRRGAAAHPSSYASRPATRTARRVSAISESSDGSTSTVVRKRPATAMAAPIKAPPAKRTVMSTIKKGVGASTAAAKKTAAVATAARLQAAPAAGTGRVLRKRT